MVGGATRITASGVRRAPPNSTRLLMSRQKTLSDLVDSAGLILISYVLVSPRFWTRAARLLEPYGSSKHGGFLL